MEPWFYFQKLQVPFYASTTRVQTYRKIDSQVGQTSALFKPATLFTAETSIENKGSNLSLPIRITPTIFCLLSSKHISAASS